MHRGDFPVLHDSQRNDISDVIFTLRIIAGSARQPAFQVRAVGDRMSVLTDSTLFISALLMFNDAGHFTVFTRNTAIAARRPASRLITQYHPAVWHRAGAVRFQPKSAARRRKALKYLHRR